MRGFNEGTGGFHTYQEFKANLRLTFLPYDYEVVFWHDLRWHTQGSDDLGKYLPSRPLYLTTGRLEASSFILSIQPHPADTRGLKHITDKRKYKGNSTKNEKYVPPKSIRTLETNWDRYDREDTNIHQLTSSTDFSILANAPVTRGNYFQFKSDKTNFNEQEVNNNKFCLNMDLLKTCILTVPFHKRLGLLEDQFTSKQLSLMDKSSLENKQLLQEIIKKQIDQTKKPGAPSTRTLNNIVEKCPGHMKSSFEKPVTKKDQVNSMQRNKDPDLEEWLDDILDE